MTLNELNIQLRVTGFIKDCRNRYGRTPGAGTIARRYRIPYLKAKRIIQIIKED